MPNAYVALKQRHQQESDAFPFMFAFSEEQFTKGMESLGLSPTDTDQIYSIGMGGYIRKTDASAMNEMFARHARERQEAIDADKTGTGYIYDMFDYELANHEYEYTGDVSDTLDALGLTPEQVNADPRMVRALNRACKRQSA